MSDSIYLRKQIYFNPRSSCEERLKMHCSSAHLAIFQSTLLMRGATRRRTLLHSAVSTFQSTLLMRGATSLILHKDTVTLISIHAPHARSDDKTHKMIHDAYRFQSTLLMRGATVSILGIDLPDFIIYFSRTYPFSPKMPTSRHLSCKLHFLCDGTSHFGDL